MDLVWRITRPGWRRHFEPLQTIWLQGTLPSGCYAKIRYDDNESAEVALQDVVLYGGQAAHIATLQGGHRAFHLDIYQKVGSVRFDGRRPAAHQIDLNWPQRHSLPPHALIGSGDDWQVVEWMPEEEKREVDVMSLPDEEEVDVEEEVVEEPPSVEPEIDLKEQPTLIEEASGGAEGTSVADSVDASATVDTAPEVDAAGTSNVAAEPGAAEPDAEEKSKDTEADEEAEKSRDADPDEEEEDVRKNSKKEVTLPHADKIIPCLYLGGVLAAADTDTLIDLGFKAVCCCCRELEMPDKNFHPSLEYYRVDVEDISREPIELFFPEATAFIHSWVKRDARVLVHCRAGVSRSSSTVLAYLIEYHGYTLHDAFFLARSHRSVVTPNVGFMEKLCEYEVQCHNLKQPTLDLNKYISWFSASDRASVPDLSTGGY